MGEEYVSFIILLAGLYVISGGVLLRGDLAATPLTNTGFLAVGSLLASFVGTTGASMLLIRPLLQTNRERTRVSHTVVFFIFTVSNIGGMLTPLGDPPLFLGYLQGVPFAWTFRLWPHWLSMTAAAPGGLLRLGYRHNTRASRRRPFGGTGSSASRCACAGPSNAVWLAGVVAGGGVPARLRSEKLAIAALAGLSLWTTPRRDPARQRLHRPTRSWRSRCCSSGSS